MFENALEHYWSQTQFWHFTNKKMYTFKLKLKNLNSKVKEFR